MLHGNGSEGKLMFVGSGSPQPNWALIPLLQHSQVLRQILSSDLFGTKFGQVVIKKNYRRKWEQSLGPAFLIETLGLRKNPISEELLLCVCSNYELTDCEFNLVSS